MNQERERCDKKVKEFVDFMKTVAVYKDKQTMNYPKRVTHMLMDVLHEKYHPYMGSFSIQGKNYNKFIQLYKSVLKSMTLFIVERPIEEGKKTGPFIIDIDYKTQGDTRQYDKTIIEKIIKISNRCFSNYLDIDKNDLVAYVQEKQCPTFEKAKNEYKDGFHIFYDIPLNYNKRKFFFDIIKSEIKERYLFKNIDTNSSYDDIVDEHVLINNGILMHGSTKKGRDPYELTHVYNCDLEELPIKDYQDNDTLVDIFSLRKYTDENILNFKTRHSELEEEIDNKNYEKEKKKEKEIKPKPERCEGEDSDKNNIAHPNTKETLEEFKSVIEYINILDVKRATGYDSWTRVGWALHNISPRLYNVFVDFSKKAPNFDESGCQKLWEEANRSKSGLTIASIKMWAKQDNPEEYEKIKNKWILDWMVKIDIVNDNDIADCIVELYGDDYKCVNITKNTWYEFQDHRWVNVDSAYTLLEKIATKVPDVLHERCKSFLDLIWSTSGKGDKVEKTGRVANIIMSLKNFKTGQTLIKTCARKMYDKKFEESLDSNPYLLGFNNGVYDLKLNVFRKGEPDDRLTLNVGYDYVAKKPPQETINEINACIQKIQPDDKMREYVQRFFASCLDGKNRDQAFRIFTGTGGNGKSVIIKLVELAFGEYYGTLPAAVLTTKDSGPNNASPYMADTLGKRLVFIHETEGDAVIQLGKMKVITGGDKITTRKLYGDPFQFTPQFKLGLCCNKLPTIPSDDGGTWRRIRVTPFKSKFVAKDKVDESIHHYLRDTSLDEEKLSTWSQTFMWMLINEYYPKYIKEGLCEPDEVREYTEKYQRDSDSILEFLRSVVDETKNKEDTEKITILYQEMKSWHKGNSSSKLNISKRDLEEYLIDKRGLDVKGDIVFGIKCKLTQ